MAGSPPAVLREAEQAGKLIATYRDNSLGFVERFFGVKPDVWQAEALSSLDAGEDVAIRSGHGVGKTALLAWIVIQTVTCFPYSKVPCTAPTQRQLRDLLWAEIKYWIDKSPLKELLVWTAERLAFRNYEENWFARACTATRPENLQGFHAPPDISRLRFIIDEASGVDDPIFEAIEGAMTTEKAQLVMAGNPTRTSGYFFDAFHKARRRWHCMRVSSEECGRVSSDYPQRIAEKFGKESPIYKVRVLGDFPPGESDAFISLSLLEEAVTRWHDAVAGQDVEIGVDVARYGNDATVFAIRYGGRVLPLEVHHGWSETETAGRALQLIRQHKARAIKVDDTGLGGGVTDMVTEGLEDFPNSCVCVACNGGAVGDPDGFYDNATAWWYGHFRDGLNRGLISLPDDEDLIGQLSTRKWKTTSKGKIRLESKDDMRTRGLPSPDMADAVVLAFAEESPASFEILRSDTKRTAQSMPI